MITNKSATLVRKTWLRYGSVKLISQHIPASFYKISFWVQGISSHHIDHHIWSKFSREKDINYRKEKDKSTSNVIRHLYDKWEKNEKKI